MKITPKSSYSTAIPLQHKSFFSVHFSVQRYMQVFTILWHLDLVHENSQTLRSLHCQYSISLIKYTTIICTRKVINDNDQITFPFHTFQILISITRQLVTIPASMVRPKCHHLHSCFSNYPAEIGLHHTFFFDHLLAVIWLMKSDLWLGFSLFCQYSLLRLSLLVSVRFCFFCTDYAYLWLHMILELSQESPLRLSSRCHETSSWLDRQFKTSTHFHSLSCRSRLSSSLDDWPCYWCSLELPRPGGRSLDAVGSVIFNRRPRKSWAGECPVSRGLCL